MKTNRKIFWLKSNILGLAVVALGFTFYSCVTSMGTSFNIWQPICAIACVWGIYKISKTETYKKWLRLPTKDMPVTHKNSRLA